MPQERGVRRLVSANHDRQGAQARATRAGVTGRYGRAGGFMSMPLGLSIASHSGLPPAGFGALAQAAELAGFSAVFVAEGHGDALALCHPVAAATRHARVGTAIANAALRPPV